MITAKWCTVDALEPGRVADTNGARPGKARPPNDDEAVCGIETDDAHCPRTAGSATAAGTILDWFQGGH